MIAKYTPAAITLLPGDVFVEIAGGFEQRRGASLVATFLKKNMTRTAPGGPLFIDSSSPFAFYVEEHMPGIVSTLVNVTRSGDAATFHFAGGVSREFSSLAEALGEVEYLDASQVTSQDALILKTIRNSPDGANLENIIGASFSADFNANVPFVLTVE